MKFVKLEIEPKMDPIFTENWMKEDVDVVLGKLVKMYGFNDVYRCIGFCDASEHEWGSDYYYILYDGIIDNIIFASAACGVDSLENSMSDEDYNNVLKKVRSDSFDLNIENKFERIKHRSVLMTRSIKTNDRFALYKSKLFWDI